MEQYKTCSNCRETKLLVSFGKDKNRADGLYPRCKLCCKYYRNLNQEKLKAYRDQHKDQLKAYAKVWRLNNPDLKRQISAAWYQKNRLQIRSKWKSKYQQNPEKYKVSARNRRARKLGVLSERYTWHDVVLRWGANCHICKKSIDLDAPRSVRVEGWQEGLHMDHVVPISKGGSDTLENVKPAHGLCNIKKKDRY